MAELKIKADSGGGTVSFKGPASTTLDAAVQLTLPVDDGTANQVLTTNGSGALSWAAPVIADDSLTEAKLDIHAAPSGTDKFLGYTANGMEWATVPAGGITNATSFRVTANWNPADSWTDITANWEVNDTAAYSTLGTAVSESSGIFSFPTTGFWYVTYGGMADYNGSAVDWVAMELQTTHNNSTYTAHTLVQGSIGSDGSGAAYCHLFGNGVIDVDNTTNVKCKLRTETDKDTTWHGSTNNNQTWITFIRLADT